MSRKYTKAWHLFHALVSKGQVLETIRGRFQGPAESHLQ